ncbi:MAG: hypothetical protein L0H41_14640 [Microlunatus sp.]|nr:hypothetical protein [Microlunatus sp.]MDN5769735.1 hypothetical protein [Microlunatus sp.]
MVDLAHPFVLAERRREELLGLMWPGLAGGDSMLVHAQPGPITFDLAEAAAVMSSLTALGPSATGSAGSAMRKLTTALTSAVDAVR